MVSRPVVSWTARFTHLDRAKSDGLLDDLVILGQGPLVDLPMEDLGWIMIPRVGVGVSDGSRKEDWTWDSLSLTLCHDRRR